MKTLPIETVLKFRKYKYATTERIKTNIPDWETYRNLNESDNQLIFRLALEVRRVLVAIRHNESMNKIDKTFNKNLNDLIKTKPEKVIRKLKRFSKI